VRRMARYRVLVVDDSLFMRKMISDIIRDHPQLEVAGVARNGKEAVDAVRRLRPDVVTMDVAMPEMNGLDAVREIMRTNPVPIVMLSSRTEEGAEETIRALEWGAVDFIHKPSGSISLDLEKIRAELYDKLLAAAQVKGTLFAQTRPLFAERPAAPTTGIDPSDRPSDVRCAVAIGASTGGPRALQAVLTGLPPSFPAAVLVVQHMPSPFTRSLAQRLDQLCWLRVKEAEDGDFLENGKVYVAPGGKHMTVERASGKTYRIKLSERPPRSGHRPSVDELFESLVPLTDLRRIAVLLTGMGSDGASGMLALKQSGAETIAEAESTCIVYGMPRAAVELDAADDVLPLGSISGRLVECVIGRYSKP